MLDIIIAIAIILLLLIGWIIVQQLSCLYAKKHPEFGPAREEGGGCGSSCLCNNGTCKKKQAQHDTQQDSNFKTGGSHP